MEIISFAGSGVMVRDEGTDSTEAVTSSVVAVGSDRTDLFGDGDTEAAAARRRRDLRR